MTEFNLCQYSVLCNSLIISTPKQLCGCYFVEGDASMLKPELQLLFALGWAADGTDISLGPTPYLSVYLSVIVIP